ncbi:MAG TPA: imidazolonepropionase, partial [Chitinophagaceae bacterium]|nr:imidazolonepropionase [Chitinophagaceae bacterium]
MAATLFTNIRQLVNIREEDQLLRGKALAYLPVLKNAYLMVENGIIAAYGLMDELPESLTVVEEIVDASGQMILPCWCDSHTHLVFAASREEEFVDKIKGLSYAEIAARGGGILNSAQKLNDTSESELIRMAWNRIQELIRLGTGAVEIKSGYGLSVEGELKMLRVIKKLKETSPIPVKATFLGAHSYPPEYRDNHSGYINLIKNEMLPVIAQEQLADYIDVFCETGFFSKEETIDICRAGMAYGLVPKIHANQLHLSGGVQAGVEVGALSVQQKSDQTGQW